MRRTLGLIAVTMAFSTIGFAPMAEAAPYGGSSSAQVSDRTPAAGQSVVVSGVGFAPNSKVVVTIEPGSAVLATLTADATGAVTGTVTIPAGTSGDAKLVLKGVTASGAAVSASMAIVVGSAGGGLPTTGSNTEPMVMWALAAVAAGGVLVLTVTRRRRHMVDAVDPS
jgi:hypothetical protein